VEGTSGAVAAPNWWSSGLGVGLFVAGCIASIGMVVPAGNELTYLVLLAHRADPNYLAGDWTFGAGFQEFAVWLTVFGPVIQLLGIEALGWIGRITTWVASGALLMLVGRRLGAKTLAAALGLILWLGLDQSMGVGATQIIAGFQARSVSYVFLLAALLAALSQRISWAMLAAGLAFAFHPGVGLWASGPLVLAILTMRETRNQGWRWLAIAVLAALPGAIPQILALGDAGLTKNETDFIAFDRLPHHVDPLVFGQRGPLLLALMVGFNLAFCWLRRTDFAYRLLGIFQTVALVPVLVGLVARAFEWTWFLVLIPFRVLPAIVPALFMLNLAVVATNRAWSELWPRRSQPAALRVSAATGAAAIAGVLVLWNPVAELATDAATNLRIANRAPSDIETVLRWASVETPTDSLLLGPPNIDELFYLSERSQYVSWEALPYDRIPEWRSRLASVMPPDFRYRRSNLWEEEFGRLPMERVLALDPRVDYVITTADYTFPALFSSGDWVLYQVTPP